VARFIRLQFSLATLLIAMAWSAVMVWLNTTPRVWHVSHWVQGTKSMTVVTDFGWPWHYFRDTEFDRNPALDLLILHDPKQSNHWALVGDVAVGVLLVVAATWASRQLLRRVTSWLRRRCVPPRSTS
jgi:hypothetical protein